jgi:DNA repair exonuclease SbcCD ATPase subunit
MTSAKIRFNRNINRAFRELELKGFENVFLDQNFGLQVVRENGVRQPIETLSASEKLTVSLILMLAAKDTFLPDFPFFILDELTLSYDPARFRHVVNYVKQRVPYIIVTSLTSEGTGKPTVTYEV